MAGTIVKSLDHKGTTSGANAVQEQFKILFDFMEAMVTAGHMTRRALQWGNGGTGTDFWDGANPFGENAFAVYSWGSGAGTARDILIQWATSDAFGASPGDPAAINGGTGDGVGIAMATREDGGSPWNGSFDNDGTDSKGTPVWAPGSSVVHGIDFAHSSVGSFQTNLENCIRVALDSPNAMRMHIVGDQDNIAIFSSETDDGSYRCCTLGRFVPRSGWSGPNPLYVMSEMQTTAWGNTTYGSSTGTATREGGVLGRLSGDGVGQLRIGEVQYTNFLNDTYQPNLQINPQELDGMTPLLVYGSASRPGLVGSFDGAVVAVVFSDLNQSVSPLADQAYVGDAAAISTRRWVLPWDGGTAPGVGATRAGRQS